MLSDNKEQFEHLNKQIEELQNELTLVKEEHQTDYLTALLNRRAYDYEVEKWRENIKFSTLILQ